jgi:hypothetical protein
VVLLLPELVPLLKPRKTRRRKKKSRKNPMTIWDSVCSIRRSLEIKKLHSLFLIMYTIVNTSRMQSAMAGTAP